MTYVVTNYLLEKTYFDFIDQESKELKIPKKLVVEKAILLYIENKKKEELEKQYQAMSLDEEYLNEMKKNTDYLSYL